MAYCKCRDINIYYEIHGDGPPIFLINGLGADVRWWQPLARFLKNSCTLIMYDSRGAGLTDKPREAYTIEQMSADTRELVSALGYERVNVLGFSMGGCVALDLAVNCPETVEKLFLVSTLPSWKRPYPPSGKINRLFHETEISEGLLEEVFETIFGPLYKKRVSAADYIKMRQDDLNPQPIHAYLNQLTALENFDLVDKIQKIITPTMIVTGDCDEVVPAENSRWMNENIINSKLVVLNGIGHMTPDETPEKLALAVTSFF